MYLDIDRRFYTLDYGFGKCLSLGDKRAKEEDYTTSFDKFGEIATVTFIKDKSGQNKGVKS